MTEVTENFSPVQQEERLLNDNSSAFVNSPSNQTSAAAANDSTDDENGMTTAFGVRRRIKRFSDSDSDNEADKENIQNVPALYEETDRKPNMSSESDDDIAPRKSRIRDNSGSSEDSNGSTSPRQEESRIGNKRTQLHQKFKDLLKSRSKVPEIQEAETNNKSSEDNGNSDSSSSGIESIKKKIKQKSMLLKSGICDPDTSSDEDGSEQHKHKKNKPKQRSAILTSPKPARMSAKQAMENMQKIKSESNRMLREKEVSLPYHRSKTLSLKDIMSRRKPALSADGKALPLKMNSEQLKQYVKLLEERNKEMMELCKSESEEEEVAETAEHQNPPSNADDCKESSTNEIIEEQKQENTELPEVDLSEGTNKDDELPELTVEIVKKKYIRLPEVNLSEGTTKDDGLPELTVDIVEKNNDSSNTETATSDVELKDIPVNSYENSETRVATEDESQLIELHYETEKAQNTEPFGDPQNPDIHLEFHENILNADKNIDGSKISSPDIENPSENILNDHINKHSFENDNFSDDFSDTDINMEDLDKIIEQAKNTTSEDTVNSPMLIKDFHSINMKPKLTGAPGMVIDLDGSNPIGPRKLTGVELLKERFTYFAKLKTPEEKERERELKLKPGMQHLKLKQDLEEQISEQRSLEWAKRLADEKQQHMEMDAVRGDESDQEEIEKIEAQLEEKEENITSESEEEEMDEICHEKEKPRKRNPMIDDEAEVSEDEDETEEQGEQDIAGDAKNNEGADNNDNSDDDEEQEDSEESSDDTSEDEDDKQSKPRKSRILKAFEDSDDENTTASHEQVSEVEPKLVSDIEINESAKKYANETQNVKLSQDDVLPLAQTNKSNSEDFFASQASNTVSNADKDKFSDKDSSDLGTQTFSILNPNSTEQSDIDNILNVPDKIDIISETQPVGDENLDDVVGLCSGKFTQTQNLVKSQSQISESQCAIGDDILQLCTGNFYDNKFVTQTQISDGNETTEEKSKVEHHNVPNKKLEEEKDLLDSILKEMEQPAVGDEAPKPKKYVFDNANEDEPVSFDVVNQPRKKFIIDSDDDGNEAANPIKKKKLKKRKPKNRALQISDDEEEEEQLISDEDAVDNGSDVDDDGEERIVEYDSEENEVVVKPQNQKKKRKMTEFFEQEAELTSEDEWVGSGDEDEAGLDRMEREAGDDDCFHQGRLQQELGQIHMRDVLDQDKREVRLIQELLFEDGDLGEGHRQRKFRWKNLDGEEETDAVPNIFGESQEEEFESEEQWRKQRHEREVFLRSLKKENETDDHNISIDRSTIIKANLCSKTMSSLLLEVNGSKIEETTVVEKKVVKEDTVPATSLSVFQQSYHGSLLTRGRGALARLAALAMPLAGEADDDAKVAIGPSSKRNFVFTTVTPEAKNTKVTKRKAEDSGTPKLIKKLKTDNKQKFSKNSLLDHLKAL